MIKSDDTTQKPTAAYAATELMEAIPAIMQFIRTQMRNQRDSSLSVPQFRVLAFLSRHSGASLSEVAEHLGVTRATASTMTDRLVRRSLIDRAEVPHERRQIMLKLTTMGNDCLDKMRHITRGKITHLLDGLTDEELEHLSAGLGILRQVFRADNIHHVGLDSVVQKSDLKVKLPEEANLSNPYVSDF